MKNEEYENATRFADIFRQVQDQVINLHWSHKEIINYVEEKQAQERNLNYITSYLNREEELLAEKYDDVEKQ